MAFLARFPKVGPGVEEAMVGAWRKREGDRVVRGEGLVEIITDKATFDLPAEQDGVLLRVVAPEKSTIPVNYVVAIIGEAGEPTPDVSEENRLLVETRRREGRASWDAREGDASVAAGPRATPSARRLARQLGVPIEAVAAAKGEGVVKDDDVRRFAAAVNAADRDQGRTKA
jgi:pyruvate/2-oxoglutarate dehydrogenase complex dihydrolipoamide acyltransferase (E2) component